MNLSWFSAAVRGGRIGHAHVVVDQRIEEMERKSSPPVTPKMASEIRYLKFEKKLFNHQIAAIFGINQGRVSEVLTGKKYPDVTPAQGFLFPESY